MPKSYGYALGLCVSWIMHGGGLATMVLLWGLAPLWLPSPADTDPMTHDVQQQLTMHCITLSNVVVVVREDPVVPLPAWSLSLWPP